MPDEDFKEQLMMHKGVISAIYQGKGLPQSTIEMYTKMYQTVEQWINEHVFGMVSQTQFNAAQQLGMFAANLGVSPNQIELMLKALESGTMKFDIFSERLKNLTDEAFNAKMQLNIESVIMRVAEKRGLIALQQQQQTVLPQTQTESA